MESCFYNSFKEFEFEQKVDEINIFDSDKANDHISKQEKIVIEQFKEFYPNIFQEYFEHYELGLDNELNIPRSTIMTINTFIEDECLKQAKINDKYADKYDNNLTEFIKQNENDKNEGIIEFIRTIKVYLLL